MAQFTIVMKELLSPVWTHLTDFNCVRGEGIYLFDDQDNRYTDFTSGIGVINTGHCHPKVVAAVQEQSSKLLFGQINCVVSEPTVQLAALLDQYTPAHIDRYFFSNSGAEATEACVKLARSATGRRNIIVFQGSFHGRTHQAMAMTTSKTAYRYNYQPLPSGVFVAPFPNSYYYGWTEDETVNFCKKQLDLLLTGQTAPSETAAIIIEPILGEGGYVPAPASFLQHLREVCDEHGIMLVLDEVQSGFGRTGEFFCFEHAEVSPDIIVMAKGLGSGLPISAIASTREIMSKWPKGTHGGTYGGGSAIAMAAARATIEVITEEKLVENTRQRGEQLCQGLEAMKAKYGFHADIRGRGLMIGVEFSQEDGSPNPELAKAVLESCINKKLLLLACGSYGNVIRWIPPLIVSETQMEEALSIFESVIQDLNV